MWLIILALLFIGLSLIIVEVIFIPGTTVVGLLGFIFTVVAIVISYKQFGNEIGAYVLIGTSAISLVALIYSFRTGAWTKFSLTSSMDNKVNEGLVTALNIGDIGTTVSTLRPVGKALINEKEFEVKTAGDYLDTGSRVKIKLIIANQIIVEPIH